MTEPPPPTPDAPRPDRLTQLLGVSEAIITGVERQLPDWGRREVARILEAWGRLGPAETEEALHRARVAGEQAAVRVVGELRALLALDPAEQSATPLQIVRTATIEPSELLAELGVPEVVRDPFDERTNPSDVYDLAPRTLADLGDPELGPLLLAWGVAKARILRERNPEANR